MAEAIRPLCRKWMAVTTSETSTYAIAGGSTGKSRLDVLAQGMQPSTLQLLERVGVPAGGTCLDVGCGGGHVTLELARLAGPSGLAVGVDFDADVLTLAEQDAAQLGVTNVQFRHGEAVRLARAVGDLDFDVAYCRFLLSHVTSPGDVVREMAGLVRPGGTVVVEDIDYRGTLCETPSEAFQRYADLYRAIVQRKGADAEIGPRLPGLLDDAGLTHVDVASFQHVSRSPQSFVKRIHALTLDRIGPALLGAGLVSLDELEELRRGLQSVADDERTLICSPRFFQAWGRQPE
jgi:SAM-dependent methyltransferase